MDLAKQKELEERQCSERDEAARIKAEERTRKEAEEHVRAAAEEREKKRKNVIEVHERVTEAAHAFKTRAEQRAVNLSAATTRLDVNLKALDASIKKNEAQIKKMKMMSADKEKEILKGIREINMSKFLSECVDALVEAKIKSSDVPAMVNVVSAMHQSYVEVVKLLIPKLASVFTKMTPEAQTAESESDRKERLARRRATLRLLAELLVAGVYTDGSVLISALRDLIEQEHKAIFGDARTMLFTIVSGFVKYAGDDILDFPPQWKVDADALLGRLLARRQRMSATLTAEFTSSTYASPVDEMEVDAAEAGGQEPEGAAGENEKDEAAASAAAASAAAAAEASELAREDAEESANDDVLEALEADVAQLKSVLTPSVLTGEQRAQLRSVLISFYQATVKAVFGACKVLHQQIKYNRQQVRQRGEVDETNLKETETATATYEKASANCRVLAEALNLEMPVMPPEPVEEARFAGEITLGGRGGDDMEEDWGSNVFEDHDTRQFYQALPDLFEMVPAGLRSSPPPPLLSYVCLCACTYIDTHIYIYIYIYIYVFIYISIYICMFI